MANFQLSPLLSLDSVSFENDLLSRKEFGSKLEGLVSSCDDRLVIALNDAWGEGKSTFLQMWANSLRSKNQSVVFFDAFEHDSSDDPLIPLLSCLFEFINQREKPSAALLDKVNKVKEAACQLAPKLALFASSVAAKGLTLGLIGASEIENFASIFERSGAQASQHIMNQLNSYSEEIALKENFRESLIELAACVRDESGAPLVFIVDELDRCNPLFSIRVLERLKHFLDVHGIVFILSIHQTQLEASIRKVYGSTFDAKDTFVSLLAFHFHFQNKKMIHSIPVATN